MIREKIADLAESVLTPDPQSQDHRDTRGGLFSFGERAEAREPSDDIEDYRDLFENNPIVRTSLRTFVQEVLEPDYEVEGANDELESWLESCAIVGALRDQDFHLLLKQALLDREIAGSACVEHVPAEEDEDALAALKLFRAETTRAYTKPNQNILVRPDDEFDEDDDYPRIDDGELAAFVQFDDAVGYDEQDEKPFTLDEVTLITRDRRTGDVWGTSRLKAVEKRANGFIEKLDNSDRAVKTLAYPHRVLRFGDEEHPWGEDEIDEAIEQYDVENFEPGMSTGVPFDVHVEELSGELPELRENVKTDVDVIMSGMPIPKYELGGFEENINQFVSESQERRQQQQIDEARRELESELTPILREKAEELDGVNADDIRLVIEPDEDEQQEQKKGGDEDTETPETEPSSPDDDPEQEDMTDWDIEVDDVEDLADPRFVSTSQEVRELRATIRDVLVEARDQVLDELENRSESIADLAVDEQDTKISASLASAVRQVLDRFLRGSSLKEGARTVLRRVTEKTLEQLASDSGKVSVEASFGLKDRQAVEFYTSTVENQVQDATDEMYQGIRTQVRRGLENGEGYPDIRRRIEDRFSDEKIRQKSGLIARMEVQNAVNGTRIREYEEDDVVVGVRAINPCGPDTTRLCRDLAGCDGEAAEAYFDEGDLSSQWMEQAPADALFEGFTPLPPAPPFHWNCRSGLVPIVEDEQEDLATRYSEGDEVSTPDGMGVVVEIRTSAFEAPSGDEVEASDEGPAYVVATEEGASVFRASELEKDEIEVDIEDPEKDVGGSEDAEACCADLQEGRFSYPESWQEAEEPARMIALKAWASMGGTFRGCRREMRGEIASPNRFCGAYKDRILGWEGWRQGGEDLVNEPWERQPRDSEGKFDEIPGSNLLPRSPEDVYKDFGDEEKRKRVSKAAQSWVNWPSTPGAEPIWKAAYEETDNENTPEEVGAPDLLDISEDQLESIREYSEFLTERLREEHGDTVKLHRILNGEAAERLRNGESLQPRTVASWTSSLANAEQIIQHINANPESSVVVTMEIDVEDVWLYQEAQPEMPAVQKEAIVALDWSEDLQDGKIRPVAEAVEDLMKVEDLSETMKRKDYPNILLGYDLDPMEGVELEEESDDDQSN